ncbi:MAG: hypothetical protein EVA89_11880 [Sandaracinaceae bacterium]|nr:MAG: hypothetical protein EVA89_11880 [Sandaracinaceae bacterium]
MSRWASLVLLAGAALPWLVVGCEPQTPTSGDGGTACLGVATPCSLIETPHRCAAAPGCEGVGSCRGAALPCSSIEGSCASHAGCRVEAEGTGHSSCAGRALRCDRFSDLRSCLGQAGCTWSGSCGGEARECGALDGRVFDCVEQPGCYVLSD